MISIIIIAICLVARECVDRVRGVRVAVGCSSGGGGFFETASAAAAAAAAIALGMGMGMGVYEVDAGAAVRCRSGFEVASSGCGFDEAALAACCYGVDGVEDAEDDEGDADDDAEDFEGGVDGGYFDEAGTEGHCVGRWRWW